MDATIKELDFYGRLGYESVLIPHNGLWDHVTMSTRSGIIAIAFFSFWFVVCRVQLAPGGAE